MFSIYLKLRREKEGREKEGGEGENTLFCTNVIVSYC